MKSVDASSLRWWTVPMLCSVVLAACASSPEVQPVAVPESRPVLQPTAAASAVEVVPPKPHEPEITVTPAAQGAFDDARRAMRSGRMDDAERGFKALTQFHPELGGPHANLGVIYRQAGKLPESAAELELATRASPKQPAYFNQLGITYRHMGQFAKARDAYERAIDLDANHAAAVLNLGILSDLYLWDPKRALELYDRYLALAPGGDATVTKWVADLKNRKPAAAAATTATPRKEKE